MFGITEKSFRLIIDTLKQYPEIQKTILFGSRALGNYKNGSDIDIAIVGKNIDLGFCIKLSAHFNQKLPIPYKVDIINYILLKNSGLKQHIDNKGIVIYENN
jgi:predicted nucleotidyltransferase